MGATPARSRSSDNPLSGLSEGTEAEKGHHDALLHRVPPRESRICLRPRRPSSASPRNQEMGASV